MSGHVKVGVSIPRDLYERLTEIMRRYGVRNRSQIIQMALRDYVLSHTERHGGDLSVVGVVAVYYDHEARDIDRRLIDIQHEYMDVIVSLQHVHVTKRFCAEFVIVRGRLGRIEEFLKRLYGLEIAHIKHLFFPVIEA